MPITARIFTDLLFEVKAVAERMAAIFCVCPEGNEYPPAPSRALSTMVKSGSRTHGLGILNIILSA